jgi:hypothetical protein
MGEAEPRALQEGEVDRLRLPYRPLLAEQGFVILHCHVTKLELKAVAGVRALQASGQVECPQCTRTMHGFRAIPQWRGFRAYSQSGGTNPSYCWGWRSYDRACKLLLKAGLIEMVSECIDTADGGLAAQYRLSASIPSPGQGGRGARPRLA